MTDAEANSARASLDAAISTLHPYVVVSVGHGLYVEFVNRGWITWETFGALGTGLFAATLPAYGKTHIVFPSMSIGVNDFKIGY
jgi:hypothetical protein